MFILKRTFTYSIVLLVCTLLSGSAFAQPQARGFGNAAPAAASANTGRTVALVVGVSDYPYVAPLNYAAEDALLMNDFLQSKAGGNVPKANICLLLNEEATLQNVVIRGISWLENTIKPTKGDRVIIYLAGHGDAVDASEAYFLCYNVNPAGDKNNYQVTGALDIGKLKSRISKFSAAGAEVVLIMDACRSGDLPGVRTGITNPFESVIERKAGETLMLSASANQLAVEDRRWGRGHGVFTWNLIQGLSGKADENGDGNVDFYEIEQYTKTNVRKETQAMGRMQVPQFAAAPSGGGFLGKTDALFLSTLSAEARSSVSIGESIAMARSTAESSWFTDSTLYSGFNELKKLVRDEKYLGEGSAEPIYARLANQFSTEQIEPVRLYYMSALAGAGFEGINQQLQMEIGYRVSSSFYAKRINYLLKAQQLQRFPEEIYQLSDYQLLLKSIHMLLLAIESQTPFDLPQDMIDSLSSMKNRFGKCAAYHWWMLCFGVDADNSNRISPSDAKYNSFLSNLEDTCAKLAPDWQKLFYIRLLAMKPEDCDVAMEKKISDFIAGDSLNSVYRMSEVIFYSKHKPLNIPKYFQCLKESFETTSQPIALVMLLSHACAAADREEFKDIGIWFTSEALRNHYHQALDDDFAIYSAYLKELVNTSLGEDYFIQITPIIIDRFIQYANAHHQLIPSAEVLAKCMKFTKTLYPDDRSLAAISSVLSIAPGFEDDRQYVDSVFNSMINRKEKLFSNPQANFIGHRLLLTAGMDELTLFRADQMRLLQNYEYTGTREDFTLFQACEFLESHNTTFPESFMRSLLEACRRNPSMENFRRYLKLAEMRRWNACLADLHRDSVFQENRKILPANALGKKLYSRVESGYHCFQNDTLKLQLQLRTYLNEGDTAMFTDVLMNLEPAWQRMIAESMLSDESIQVGFINLVNLGLYERAEKEYTGFNKMKKTYFGGETEFYEEIEHQLAAIKLFSLQSNYANAAAAMEYLIDLCVQARNTPDLIEPVLSQLGPYDEFIKSKEYKTMMARVYKAPVK